MTQAALFEAALGITAPWFIDKVDFQPGATAIDQGTMTISIKFNRGSLFTGSDKQQYTAYDTRPRQWRHLNFFQHVCLIEADLPRVMLANGKVETVEVPWGRPGSHFTLLFEAFCLLLIKSEMSLNQAARVAGTTRDSIERIFNHYVEQAIDTMACGQIQALGIDETSTRKGHKYITVGVDLTTRRVVSVVEGKDAASLFDLRNSLESKGVQPDEIEMLTMDMSGAYIKGAAAYFPEASVTFDKFHIVKLINEAVDKTRRLEQATSSGLKKTRYTWLLNPEDLNLDQQQLIKALMKTYPTMGEAYRLKLQFKAFWQSPQVSDAKAFLNRWIARARKIGNIHFNRLADTLHQNMQGILNYVTTGLTNGILESINSKIQLAKRRARGYKNMDNFINMIYFLTADLKIQLPTINR